MSLNEAEIFNLLFTDCFQMCLASILFVTKEHATQEEGGPAFVDLTHLWHRDIYLKKWQLAAIWLSCSK